MPTWDEAKRRDNLRDHGLDFEGAEAIWDNFTVTREEGPRNMKRAITLKPPKTTSAKAADRDNPPWSEEMLGPPVVRRGRGAQKAPTKVLTTIRLDADVIAFFRAQGSGYQSRINETLRRAKERGLTTRSTRTARKRAAG
jgi:uncharacterized protein (DUF4415 family)